MSDEMQDEPVVLAKRSATQAKNATKNAGRAVKAAAEPVVETVAEEIHETVDKLEGTAEDAVRAVSRFNMQALSGLAGDTAMGFFALSVSFWAGHHAVNKFRGVYAELRS